MSTNREIRIQRRTAIQVLVGGLAVVITLALLIPLLSGSQPTESGGVGASERRNANDRPRNTDVWLIYPDNSIQFSTLFYPSEDEFNGDANVFALAGPLINAQSDVIAEKVIGGPQINRELLDDPTPDSGRFYNLYTLTYRSPLNGPYGLEVRVQNAPYVSTLVDGLTRAAIFGAETQTFYSQVIVAVGVPVDSSGITFPRLQPYRELQLGGWLVFYFDVTSPQAGDLIYLEFTPGTQEPRPLGSQRVDRNR